MIFSIASRAKAYSHARAKVLADVWNHPLNRGSKWHAIRDYVLWNAVRFTMDARHVVRLPDGVEIIVGPKDQLGTGVYVHFLPDFAEMLFLAHLLQPGDLFADVGANVGMYSVWVSRVTSAKVIALEPVPSTYETLRQNVRLNNLEALIEPLRTAAGDISGEVLMSSEMAGSNHILPEKRGRCHSNPDRPRGRYSCGPVPVRDEDRCRGLRTTGAPRRSLHTWRHATKGNRHRVAGRDPNPLRYLRAGGSVSAGRSRLPQPLL